MKAEKRWLWITDPWTTLDHPNDTTLRFMEESIALKLNPYWCDVKTIRLEDGITTCDAHPLLSIQPERSKNSAQWGKPEIKCDLSSFDQIHYRPDPPIHSAYLHPLQLLFLYSKNNKKLPIFNPPEILLQSNEKMEATALGLAPPQIISSQWSSLCFFGKKYIHTVVKPLGEANSNGVDLLKWSTKKERNESYLLLKKKSDLFTTPVVLEKYLKKVRHKTSGGEIRLWFANGKLIGKIKRLPLSKDFRVLIDQGSGICPCEQSDQIDLRKIRKISDYLKKKNINLAAVDLIDGYITDFNFTSPGLIPQMEKTLNINLAKKILRRLMEKK